MTTTLNCYNRGCGQTFEPENNDEDKCCFHPGLPFFHDAYKGWSCCNKKSVDFTEFLNIKGCTMGKHSNEKPPEMPKSNVDKETAHIPVTVNLPKPMEKQMAERPPFETPLKKLTPTIAESLKKTADQCPHNNTKHSLFPDDDSVIMLGTKCKNGGCACEYNGPKTDTETCVHHPGVPVFHEGMKYWSCCQKKTSDFNTFLSQVGCTKGTHKWKKEVESSSEVKCRWDWHQTGGYVVVAIYAKQYNPETSWVKVNPIRLCVQLEFPKEGNATFNMDLELRGMIDLSDTTAHMYGTKVEIKMKKCEPGSWVKLDIPRPVEPKKAESVPKQHIPKVDLEDDLDLDDVEPIEQLSRTYITEIKE